MNKYIAIIFLIFLFYSCDNEYKTYYKSGNLKAEHIILNNKRIDSSVYYSDTKDKQVIRITRFINDSIQYNFHYNDQKELAKEGKIVNINDRIGKWKFHKKDHDSIVEYKYINSTSYTNQIWIVSKKKDTLMKGNFFRLYQEKKDTIRVGELLKINIFLAEPFYSYDTDIEVLFPLNDSDLNYDYSNFFNIKLDTAKSLKNDGIPNVGIHKDVPINQIVKFGVKYESSGKKKIRGVLVEYKIENGEKIERRLFFEREIFVLPIPHE